MRPPLSPLLAVLVLAGVAGAGESLAATCPEPKQVFVRPKTPVRKGPGLNYPVSEFLERGRCGRLEQVSVDGRWTLVKWGARFGWVLSERLSAAGQEAAVKARRSSAPVGSGTERAFSEVVERTVLRERPQAGAAPRRVLPAGVRLLPLQVTDDGLWAQVRDDRGDTGWVERAHIAGGKIEGVPRARATAEAAALEAAKRPIESVPGAVRLARRRVGARNEDVHLSVSASGAMIVPMQSLDSNGARGIRRYDLSAFSGGAALELQLTDLGPITARAGWTFGFMGGIDADTPEATGNTGGFVSALLVRAGWPFRVKNAVITPEVGYAFDATELDVAVAGATEATFLSTQVHSGLLGGRVQVPFDERFLIEGDLAVGAGIASSSPGSLGSGGFAWGGRASVGIQYLLDAAFGLSLRYGIEGWTADFSGTSTLDPTITEATLLELRNIVLLGVTYAL